jgi:hypothetical protein
MIIQGTTVQGITVVDMPPAPTLAGSLSFAGGASGTNQLNLSPGFAIGAGSYTIEGWFRLPNFTSAYGLVGANATNGYTLYVSSSTLFTNDKYGGGGQFSYTVPTMSINTWYYFAMVRSGTTEALFLGTTAGGTATRAGSTQTNALNYSVATPRVGTYYGASWPGLMTNLRIVVGTAVYDPTLTTLTIPSSPLTSIANTKYLMLGDTVTSDASGTQTITVTGTVTQTATKPF